METLNRTVVKEAKASNAGVNDIRAIFKRSKDMYKVERTRFVILEGWNNRIDFDEIPELAHGIVANKGTDAVFGKLLEDNTVQAIDGERRILAYNYIADNNLSTEEWVNWIPCILAPVGMSIVEMMYKKGTTNNGKPFKPFEEAAYFQELMDAGESQADIAKRLGHNRQHVSMRLALHTATGIERDMVAERIISATELSKLIKAQPDVVVRVNYLLDAAKRPNIKIDVWNELRAKGYTISEEGEAIIANTPPAPEPDIPAIDIKDDVEGIEGREYAGKPYVVTGEAFIVDPAEANSPGLNEPGGHDDQGEYILKENEIRIQRKSEPGVYTIRDTTDIDLLEYQHDYEEVDAENKVWQLKDGVPFSRVKTGLSALLDQGQVKSTEPYVEPEQNTPVRSLTAKEVIYDNVGSTLGDVTPITGTVQEALRAMAITLKLLDRMVLHDGKLADISLALDKNLRYVQNIVRARPDLGGLEWDEANKTAVTKV